MNGDDGQDPPLRGAAAELLRRQRAAQQQTTTQDAAPVGGAAMELLRRQGAPPTPSTPRGASGSWGDYEDYGAADEAVRGMYLHGDRVVRPAVDAATDVLFGRADSFKDAYRQRQRGLDAAREAYEQAHGTKAKVAEFAGGLLPALATFGATAPATAAVEAAPEAVEAATALTRGAKLAKAGITAAKLAGHGAVTGGGLGVVQGAFDANGDLSDYARSMIGSGIGGAIGGAVAAPVIGGALIPGAIRVGRFVGVPKVAGYIAQKAAGPLLASEHPLDTRVGRALATIATAANTKGTGAAAQLAPSIAADVAGGHVAPDIPADFETLPIDLQGPAVQAVARDIASKPSPAGVRIAQALSDRASRMRDIVSARLERGVGMTRPAAEQFTQGLAGDEAARVAANAQQDADFTTALTARKAELAARAAEPAPEPPNAIAAWEGIVGGPTQNNIRTMLAQRAARSAAAAENFGAARAAGVARESPALDALAETDLGKAGLRLGEQQMLQRRAAAAALGQPSPARAIAAPAAPAAPVSEPLATVAPIAPAAVAPTAPTSTVGGIPGLTGRTGQALLRTGEALPVEYRIVSRGDVQPSHDPFSFAPNPNYPEGVQGRDYLRNKGIQSAVTRRTFDFSPDIALNPSESLSEGVPTILPNGTVVAGNERTMLLARVAAHAPERGAAYVQALKARASDYGIDPAAVDQIKDPMLVRVLANPAEAAAGPPRWADLNRLSDEVATKGKSTVEEGAARANALLQRPEALAHLSDTLDPNSTVNEYLGTSDGRKFVRQLVTDGVIRADELSRYTDASGTLNQEGRNAVRSMMLSTAVTRPAVVHDAPATALGKIEHAVPSIVSTRGTKFDIAPLTTEALQMLGEARDLGMTVHDLSAQHGLFGDVPRSPMATHLAEFIEQNKAGAVKAAFRKFGNIAKETVANEGAGDLFGASPFQTIPDVYHEAFGTPSETAPAIGLAEHIPPAPVAAAPPAPPVAAPVAPSAPVAPAADVAQLPTAAAPVRAAPPTPGAKAGELPPLVVPPGKTAPAPMYNANPEAWDRALRTMQAAGRDIPWVDAPTGGKAATAVEGGGVPVPPEVPEPKVYDPESIHYAKQYFAKVAKLGVNDGQGGILASKAYGALKLWEAARMEARADPLWAHADDVFANQSRHIDMTELGRGITRTTLDPAGRKALSTSLDAIEARVAAASPSEQEAFRSAGQAAVADYFRKGGSRVGLSKQLGDPTSQWSRRIALVTGDADAPAAFRDALLTPSKPVPPELAPLIAPPEVQLSPIAAARRLGYDAPRAELSPSAAQAAAGRALPSVEATIGALPPAEARAAQQGAAAQLLGDWEGASRSMKSPGRFFASSPERARQVALAFPTPEDAASLQQFVGAADRAQALNNFVLPTSGSATQPRAVIAAQRQAQVTSPILEALKSSRGGLWALGGPKGVATGIALKALKGALQSRAESRQAVIDDLISQWLTTPGGGGDLARAAQANQLRQQLRAWVARQVPAVAGAAGTAVANP